MEEVDIKKSDEYQKLYEKYSDPKLRAPAVPIRGTDPSTKPAPYLSTAKDHIDEATGHKAGNGKTEWKTNISLCSWCQGEGKCKVTSNYIVRDVCCEKCDGEGIIYLDGKPPEPAPYPVKGGTDEKKKKKKKIKKQSKLSMIQVIFHSCVMLLWL